MTMLVAFKKKTVFSQPRLQSSFRLILIAFEYPHKGVPDKTDLECLKH